MENLQHPVAAEALANRSGWFERLGNDPTARSLAESFRRPGFNVQMSFAVAAILIVSYVGCKLTSVVVADVVPVSATVAFAFLVLVPLLLYLQEKGKLYLRDAVLTIVWGILLYCILNFPVTIAARLGMSAGLKDQAFLNLDEAIHIHVPSIYAWSNNHGLGGISARIYWSLMPLLWIAVLLPTLFGKVRDAQRFLISNILAFSIGLPIFALLPAIGPWYGYHLAARIDQTECQALLMLIRTAGPYVYHSPAGIICLPSFHVIWAMLCAQALWGFRYLRIPVTLLTAMIVCSTMTTGVHYFVDVVSGMLVAALAIYGAQRLMRRLNDRMQREPINTTTGSMQA